MKDNNPYKRKRFFIQMKLGEGINVIYGGFWPQEDLKFAKGVIDQIPLTVECDEHSRGTGRMLDISVSRKTLHWGTWGVSLNSEGPVVYSGIEHLPPESYYVSYLTTNQESTLFVRHKSSGLILYLE